MKTFIVFIISLFCSNGLLANASHETETLPLQGTSVSTSAANTSPSASFFKTHHIVFFFASTCPHCHHQAPVLARWASAIGAPIDARSFDDKPLVGFVGHQAVTKDLVDAAFAGKPISYPALFIMNEENHALYPVAFGALDDIQLQARMDALILKIIQYEQGLPS